MCGHPAIGRPTRPKRRSPGTATPLATTPSSTSTRSSTTPRLLRRPRGAPRHHLRDRCRPTTPEGTTGLATDLKSIGTTPNFSFITPNLCYDGHDSPCINQQGSASPFANIDTFLQTWVPLITGSPAFKKNGLLEVTFDEADTDNGDPADATACCNEIPGRPRPIRGSPGREAVASAPSCSPPSSREAR